MFNEVHEICKEGVLSISDKLGLRGLVSVSSFRGGRGAFCGLSKEHTGQHRNGIGPIGVGLIL